MPKKREKLEWGGYLNVRLTQEQHRRFDVWYGELKDDVWDLFLQALSQGMKYSLVYDAEIDTYTASLMNTPRCTCGLNSLYVLSAYAPDWRVATALLMFKHYQLLGGTWENYSPAKPIQGLLG